MFKVQIRATLQHSVVDRKYWVGRRTLQGSTQCEESPAQMQRQEQVVKSQKKQHSVFEAVGNVYLAGGDQRSLVS
jgi:hypothetical protein